MTAGEMESLPVARVEASLALQADLGAGIPNFQPKVLPQSVAAELGASYGKQKTGNDKYEFLKQFHSQYGEFANLAAEESGLPPAARVVTQSMNTITANEASRLLILDSVDDKDIAATPEEKKAATEKVNASNFMRAQRGIAATMPLNPELLLHAQEFADMLVKAELLGMDLSTRMDMYYRNMIPAEGLRTHSANFPSHALIIPHEAWQKLNMPEFQFLKSLQNIKNSVAMRLHNNGFWAEAMRLQNNDVTWVNDGENLMAIDGITGKHVFDEKGQPVIINLFDVGEENDKALGQKVKK